MDHDEPIGYIITWGSELNERDTEVVTFTTDRDEAHRLYADAERLDRETIERTPFSASLGFVTLQNVYGPTELFKTIAQDAMHWDAFPEKA